jgi:hypothetical protein
LKLYTELNEKYYTENKGQYYKLTPTCGHPKTGLTICPENEVSCEDCSRRKRVES